MRRVADKGAGTVTEVLLVLDATTGQNGLVQARQFTEAVEVTGVVLTKLDGSAKGGIVVRHPVRARHPGEAGRPRRDAPTTWSPSTPTSSSTPCSPDLGETAVKPLGRLLILPFKLLAAAVGDGLGSGRRSGAGRLGRRIARCWGPRAPSPCCSASALGLAFAPRARPRAAGAAAGAARPPDRPQRRRAGRAGDASSSSTPRAPGTCPQPSVTVVQGRVDPQRRRAQRGRATTLARVAGAVPGVAAVDNLVVVRRHRSADGEAE